MATTTIITATVSSCPLLLASTASTGRVHSAHNPRTVRGAISAHTTLVPLGMVQPAAAEVNLSEQCVHGNTPLNLVHQLLM